MDYSKKYTIIFTLFSFVIGNAHANEDYKEWVDVIPETVVTASRYNLPAEKVGSSHTILYGDELEEQGINYVSDALRLTPGIAVNRSGSFGSQTQIRMRGSEGNHTLVLVDGIEMSNLSDGELDLANITTHDVERIEIIRGPQSSIWGSNALSGVINIITKTGARDGWHFNSTLKAGSFDTYHGSLGVSWGNDRARFALNGFTDDTDGTNIARRGSEVDGNRIKKLHFKGDIDLTKDLNIAVAIHNINRKNEYDDTDYTIGKIIDTDKYSIYENFAGKADATLKTLDGKLIHNISFKTNRTNFDNYFQNEKNGGSNGKRYDLSYQSTINFSTPELANANHTFTGYVEYKHEKFRNTPPNATDAQKKWYKRNLYGIASEYRLDLWNRLFLAAALRYDDNDKFKNAFTYNFTSAYLHTPTNTKLRSSIGKGVTNPTFIEQFGYFPGSFINNKNLKPEKSIGWEVGIEQTLLAGRVIAGVSFFRSNLRNEINSTFDNTTSLSSVENMRGKSKRKGVEITLAIQPAENIYIKGAYSYIKSKDSNSKKELRRPKHSASGDIAYRFFNDKANININTTYNGKMLDSKSSMAGTEKVTIKDYVLVGIAGGYKFNNNFSWFFKAENLLNKKYEEVYSYRSPGFGAYTGIKITF